MANSLPLISCIMPTANRRRFVPLAIRCFQAQDYPNRELVIVDDGADSVADLIPDDPQIRYIRLEGKRTLGAKRNECVRLCHGDLIMHWDDDDWMAPHRINYQVKNLLNAKAQVCGLHQMLFYEPSTHQTWLYHYSAKRAWLAGGSLLYTRDFWERAPFPDVQVASDTHFILKQRMDRAVVLPDYHFYVAMIHARNTSPKRRRGSYWRRWDGNLKDIMGDQLADYQASEHVSMAVTHRPLTGLDRPTLTTSQRAQPTPETLPHITVSIPYYGCKPYIARAVESILNQTYQHLMLVVTNDGDLDPPWDVLSHIDDPRLVRFDLSVNRGRYFADAVVLGAISHEYFVVQDADDWSEPTRLEVLLRKLREQHADAAMSLITQVHNTKVGRSGSHQKDNYRDRLMKPLTDQFEHRCNHCGLFKVESLRRIGGYYAGFRIGFDTLLVNLLLMTGRIAYVEQPLYYRLNRANSLVNSPETGLRSKARLEAAQELRTLYQQAFADYSRYLSGYISLDTLSEQIRALCTSRIPIRDQTALQSEIERLKHVLSEPHPPAISGKSKPQKERPLIGWHDLRQKLDNPNLAWDGWAIDKVTAAELAFQLEVLKPRRILEVGSGNSTIVLARYAERYGAELLSLDHDSSYFKSTDEKLKKLGLRSTVDLELAPLIERECGDGTAYPWYSTALSGVYDFAFVDGPPERFGRQAALFALSEHLAPNWELWLHDGNRPHEQACLDLWRQHFAFSSELHQFEDKGVVILRGEPPTHRQIPKTLLKRLGITILTGGRPDLLRRTVSTLQMVAPELLNEAHVIMLVNTLDRDSETRDYVETLDCINHLIYHEGKALTTGQATSRLLMEVTQHSKLDFVLHLEDDWNLCTLNRTWLQEACRLLMSDPSIGQVRLRHCTERVLTHHMITKRPIRWEECNDHLKAVSAHFTFNPSLMRREDIITMCPFKDEAEAQRKYVVQGRSTAQLLPGVFRHIGYNHSLQRYAAAYRGQTSY